MKRPSLIISILLTCAILAGKPTQTASLPQPVQNIAQKPDLSKIVITQQDLPSDFQTANPAELEQLRRNISLQELPIQSVFQFSTNPENMVQLGVVMGGTYWISNSLAQTDFMSNPDRLMRQLTGVVGDLNQDFPGLDLGRHPTQQLTNLESIGDFASGATRVINTIGFPIRMDLVAFRRGRVVAFVGVGYIEGTRPAVSVVELARKLDSRIPK
ncbi:MAG: hypothetical protein ACM37W_24375 [Actinomycetota bacterium]